VPKSGTRKPKRADLLARIQASPISSKAPQKIKSEENKASIGSS
jgi:hypothetical protein